jgi:hypothetical protein
MSARKAVPTPKAVVTSEVCSLCGLGWKRHGKDATAEECIRLLKMDLAAASIRWPYPQYPHPIITHTEPLTRERPWPGYYLTGSGLKGVQWE